MISIAYKDYIRMISLKNDIQLHLAALKRFYINQYELLLIV